MKNLVVLILLFSPAVIHAQQKSYFVFLLSGDVWIKTAGHAPAKAKPKQALSMNDIIEIRNEKSEVTVANTAGNYSVLKEKGAYKISDLQKREGGKTPAITPKFLSFLYDELLHPRKGSNRFSQENVAASWGAGSRGNACMNMKWPLINLVSSRDTIVFKWAPNNKVPGYNFVLYDRDGEEIFNCIVRDTQLVVYTKNLKKGDKEKYSWSINSTARPCPTLTRNFFELVSKDEEKKMADKLIKEVPKNENEVLYNLEIADLLGLNGLYDMAFGYFSKSYQLLKNL